ncbi:MAG: sigma-70 family RNA polymerase sigma factor [Acidobacteria bacterium]|nr:sigma-70 family RNA polymerase sigma factor [Acidobacteriota bacterium]
MSDLELILERCRQGDELAWEALVRRYQSRVYATALQYVRDTDEALDLAQDIFVRVYKRLETFQGHETFLPWLMRLARNAAIDHLRRRKARPPRRDVQVEDNPPLPDTSPLPDANWESKGRRQLVHNAMGQLTSTNREMILLKEIQGLNLKEIAELLGIPVGTVKSRSNRARLELARVILALDPSAGMSTP